MVAHRGEHLNHHENTLEAIDGAVTAGADFVEIDVRRTRDGHYVLMHDRSLDRMTDGKGPLAERTLAELQALRVFSRALPNVPASRIPRFEEVLARCRGRINIYLDFKAGDRGEVAGLIREAGMLQQVLVYDGLDGIKPWRKAAPELPLIVSVPSNALRDASAIRGFITSHSPEALDGDWPEYKPATVAEAGQLGARVIPDVQDGSEGPDYWARVIAVGFQGAQTDHPADFVAWLRKRGLHN